MKKYLVEFIGAFFLVLTVGMTVIDPGSAGPLAPLAIGAAMMIMVYAGAHVSGGHYNPAITVAVWLRGRCAAAEVAPYLGAQAAGAVVAALTVLGLKGDPTIHPDDIQLIRAFIAELVGTFALCYVVLNVTTAKSTAGNSYYGLAIGFTVMVMTFALGYLSNGAFNPAAAIGLAVLHKAASASLGMFIAAEFAAGILAALVFRFVNPEDN